MLILAIDLAVEVESQPVESFDMVYVYSRMRATLSKSFYFGNVILVCQATYTITFGRICPISAATATLIISYTECKYGGPLHRRLERAV